VLGAGDAEGPGKVMISSFRAVAAVCGAGETVSAVGARGANGINSAFGVIEAGSIVLALGIVGFGATVGLTWV